MRSHRVISAVATLVVLGAAAGSWSQDVSPVPPSATVGAYPESGEGLTKLVEDMFGAVKSKDDAKISSYVSALAIPDHNAWFAKTFGGTEGARMEAKYIQLLPSAAKNIRRSFEYALRTEHTNVSVKLLDAQGATGGLSRAIVDAMGQPISVYIVDGNNPKEKFATHIGDFVFVDGGFRYMDSQVWQALSTAPPLRIRLGGNVAKANLINRVEPVYPEQARAVRMEGDVLLHIVVATDGAIKELNVVSGDPILAKAAVEAVKQWRHKPILLNGTPVEVDSTVSVMFRFK